MYSDDDEDEDRDRHDRADDDVRNNENERHEDNHGSLFTVVFFIVLALWVAS